MKKISDDPNILIRASLKARVAVEYLFGEKSE
jgi:hypothetical protein